MGRTDLSDGDVAVVVEDYFSREEVVAFWVDGTLLKNVVVGDGHGAGRDNEAG